MELKTKGLTLRPWELDDAPALIDACDEAEIARWLPVIPQPYTDADAQTFLRESREKWDRAETYNFAITDAANGELVGSIAVSVRRFSIGHIGYWVASEARGRGTATDALKALCRWCVDTLQLKRLELLADTENVASQRVAEKAGFRREGILRSTLEYRDGTRNDSVIFSLLADEL